MKVTTKNLVHAAFRKVTVQIMVHKYTPNGYITFKHVQFMFYKIKKSYKVFLLSLK